MKQTGLAKQIEESGKEELTLEAQALETYSAISAIAQQEGGKILIKSLTEDCINAIDKLCNGYENFSLVQFQSQCATLNERLNLLHTLTRAGENKKRIAEELESALAE